MIYNYLFCLLLTFSAIHFNAQTTINGSFDHDGINRTYALYIPASYSQGQPVPLVLNLHGYTSTGALQAIYGDFKPIADTANFLVVHPNGTPDPISGFQFWNFGIFGTNVDDVGFLEALIDTISIHYSINPDRVYCTGISNGGFMTYAMACESDRFAAIGSVTGSMSVTMYNNCNPHHPTPAIHIHGTADSTNPYNGNSSSMSIPDVVSFWTNQNSCNTTPGITSIADIDTGDGCTAEQYVYSGGADGHTVEHFKVTGGGHTWPGSSINLTGNGNTCHDFNASNEIWRFFSQYELSTSASNSQKATPEVSIWPNPSEGMFYFQSDDHQIIYRIVVMDLQGRIVDQITGTNIKSIDLRHLTPGNYIIRFSGAKSSLSKMLTISAAR